MKDLCPAWQADTREGALELPNSLSRSHLRRHLKDKQLSWGEKKTPRFFTFLSLSLFLTDTHANTHTHTPIILRIYVDPQN
jgi:hypothetical protein